MVDCTGNPNKLPSVDLKTLDGKTVNSSHLSNDGNPIILSFWAFGVNRV